jgi:hypothetical protein
MDDRRVRVRVPVGFKNFHFSISSKPALGSTQPSIPWVRGLSPRVKQQGREADHSPRTSAEVKKMWIYTSTPPHVLMAQCLVKHRNSFTFLPLYPHRYVDRCRNTGHTQKNGAVSKVIKKIISHLTRAQHTLSAAGTVQISQMSITILQCMHLWPQTNKQTNSMV